MLENVRLASLLLLVSREADLLHHVFIGTAVLVRRSQCLRSCGQRRSLNRLALLLRLGRQKPRADGAKFALGRRRVKPQLLLLGRHRQVGNAPRTPGPLWWTPYEAEAYGIAQYPWRRCSEPVHLRSPLPESWTRQGTA